MSTVIYEYGFLYYLVWVAEAAWAAGSVFECLKQSDHPWLFGNWWQSEKPNEPLQLIGIGVRLSRTANIEDGVGNTSDTVEFRGSLIRIRSENGSPLAGTIPERLLTTSSASLLAFLRIERWFVRLRETVFLTTIERFPSLFLNRKTHDIEKVELPSKTWTKSDVNLGTYGPGRPVGVELNPSELERSESA